MDKQNAIVFQGNEGLDELQQQFVMQPNLLGLYLNHNMSIYLFIFTFFCTVDSSRGRLV